ncbi:MAG: hypothetical protein ACD_14C00022G0006 [uncultured bacterium]|nr:MAG: hypothetical protein ACD_14C00022G0006 [uncultured bacterium]KKQ79842.1 MAG: hypothetical protein UT03_C0040G0005 [Candidatus Moranbacteria bacterium GW2011_GWD2_38_7]
MKKEIGKMLDQMQEGSEDFKSSVEDTLEEAKDKVKEARFKADKYILENPERSVLVSAGVGIAIGFGLAMLLKGKMNCRSCRS